MGRLSLGSECLLMALFGHATCTDECPLLGVKRTSLILLTNVR